MKKIGHLSIKQILEKFREIDPITNCWLWTRCKNNQGYGIVELGHSGFLVHRLSYEEFTKKKLKKLCLHKIICPNRHCFNPDHLYDGDYGQNMYDKVILGNHFQTKKTHCPLGHTYDKKNTRLHRGRRYCKKCVSLAGMRYRNKLKEKSRERIKLKNLNNEQVKNDLVG